jgi:hypothetical protein
VRWLAGGRPGGRCRGGGSRGLDCVSDQRQHHAHRRSIYPVGWPSAARAGGCLRARQGVIGAHPTGGVLGFGSPRHRGHFAPPHPGRCFGRS